MKGVRFPVRLIYTSLLDSVQTSSEKTQPPVQWLFLGMYVKRLKDESDSSLPSVPWFRMRSAVPPLLCISLGCAD
jgi:hypothetical protein